MAWYGVAPTWRILTLPFFVAVAAALALGVGLWLSALSVRYRMMRDPANGARDTVTVHYATRLKNGQIEIYYNQPAALTCVRALLPHQGLTPCWYVRRTQVVVL